MSIILCREFEDEELDANFENLTEEQKEELYR